MKRHNNNKNNNLTYSMPDGVMAEMRQLVVMINEPGMALRPQRRDEEEPV